ncbi:MAG: hypothetical protein RPS47_04620 [Colwellia sp.]
MNLKLIGLVVSMPLVGCSMFGEKIPAGATHSPQSQLRQEQLISETHRLLSSIDESLRILSETKQGKIALNSTPDEMKHREWVNNVTPAGMGVPMTITERMMHPVAVLQMLAGSTGYDLVQIGKPRSSVRNVTVSYISRPAIEILRSVAYQMGCDGLVDPQAANRKLLVDWTVRARGACTE